jgi:hypothetical protein
MKECDNSTRKIHISSNFILSISLLIMFDTLLLRPLLHCNTPLHFSTLHSTTIHHTYQHFTSSHLHFPTLSFSFTHLLFLVHHGENNSLQPAPTLGYINPVHKLRHIKLFKIPFNIDTRQAILLPASSSTNICKYLKLVPRVLHNLLNSVPLFRFRTKFHE